MPRRLRRAWGSVGAGLRPRPLSGVDGACRRIRRGRPACRPVGGSRAEVCPGGHIGRPLHGVEGIPNQRKIGAKTDLANGAGQSPPPTGATQVVRSNGPMWAALRGDEGRHAESSCPTGGCGEPPRFPWVAAHSGASAARVRGSRLESRQRSSPKGSSTPDNPSVTAAPCQLPLHKGALGTGDADRRVGPVGLLAMTSVFCHSEERSDVGIRLFYDGRGLGPPYLGHGLRRPNFVPKFGRRSSRRPLRKVYRSPSNGPMWSSAPTPCGGRGNGTPGSSCPTGGRREVSSIAEAALSEAESAGIAAGQIRSLPDDLRVQHGVPGSEV